MGESKRSNQNAGAYQAKDKISVYFEYRFSLGGANWGEKEKDCQN